MAKRPTAHEVLSKIFRKARSLRGGGNPADKQGISLDQARELIRPHGTNREVWTAKPRS